MRKIAVRYIRVALSVAGSAILLFSCERGRTDDSSSNEETMMTEYSEELSVVMSQNGRRSYHFATPLLEGYTLGREPYREFRKGVKITTYKDDSLSTVDVVLTANYAIYYENRELWEAKGDVVAEKSDGKTLYTQQLFWNAKTKKIYSNVDSKIVQNNGRDVFIGEGFESDEEFKDWRFRRMKGRMEVDAAAMQRRDSTAAADSVAGSIRKPSAGIDGGEQPSQSGRKVSADAPGREQPPQSGRVKPAGSPVRQGAADRERGRSRRNTSLQPQGDGPDRRFEPAPVPAQEMPAAIPVAKKAPDATPRPVPVDRPIEDEPDPEALPVEDSAPAVAPVQTPKNEPNSAK